MAHGRPRAGAPGRDPVALRARGPAGHPAPLPVRGVPVAELPVGARPRWDPRGRHGAGQDRADHRRHAARRGPRSPAATVPGDRPHLRGGQLVGRAHALRAVAADHRADQHQGLGGQRRAGLARGADLLRPAPSRRGCLPRRRVGRRGHGRGAVREEPADQGLPRREEPEGPHPPGHHRHPHGEQPYGAVVSAVPDRTGAVPVQEALHRALPAAHRTCDGLGRPGPAALPHEAVHAAPLQGGRGPAAATQARARAGRGAQPRAPRRVRPPAAARARQDPGAAARLRQEPLHDLPVPHHAAHARPGPRPGGPRGHRGLLQAGRPLRAAPPAAAGGPPPPGVQPVHELPEDRGPAAGRGRDRLRLPGRQHPGPRRGPRHVPQREGPGVPGEP